MEQLYWSEIRILKEIQYCLQPITPFKWLVHLFKDPTNIDINHAVISDDNKKALYAANQIATIFLMDVNSVKFKYKVGYRCISLN